MTVVERDVRGDGRIVVRVGPADASAVLVVVPGVGTDQTDEARLTADAGVLWRVVSAGAEDPRRVAVVSWLGYDPPDVALGALDPRPADVGARDLIRAVAAMRDAGAERVTVVGHSYGAVVAGRAAADGMQADALVQLGAPGVGRPGSAAAITRRGVEHLAAREADDPVRWAVPFTRFVFGEDPMGRASALPTSGRGHTAYLGDAVLLEALAHIALGRGQPVRSGS